MGLTFLGWANNVGDFVADLAIAKDGHSRCAFSAAFAGPPLYLLASVGLACFVTSITHSFEPIPIFIENVEVVLFIRNWSYICSHGEVNLILSCDLTVMEEIHISKKCNLLCIGFAYSSGDAVISCWSCCCHFPHYLLYRRINSVFTDRVGNTVATRTWWIIMNHNYE